MRSSKSRSRSKSNRSRSVGNIVNRVFDSSGPEGKVRGTPQQIIDKYNQLARDAQLGNDRVAFENFQQHAEHYTRMLSEAQREQDARREQQDQQNRERNQGRDRDDDGDDRREADAPRHVNGQDGGERTQGERAHGEPAAREERSGGDERPDVRSGSSDVLDLGDEESGLVETPESRPAPRPRRRRRAASADGEGDGNDKSEDSGRADKTEAAE